MEKVELLKEIYKYFSNSRFTVKDIKFKIFNGKRVDLEIFQVLTELAKEGIVNRDFTKVAIEYSIADRNRFLEKIKQLESGNSDKEVAIEKDNSTNEEVNSTNTITEKSSSNDITEIDSSNDITTIEDEIINELISYTKKYLSSKNKNYSGVSYKSPYIVIDDKIKVKISLDNIEKSKKLIRNKLRKEI